MPGIEDQPPSADQVSIIRQKFQEYIAENGKGMQIILPGLNIWAPGNDPIIFPILLIIFSFICYR